MTTYLPGQTITRTSSEPLLPGDFVDLGTFGAGTQPDGINHVVAFASVQLGSPYLLIGFEDLLGGGDLALP